jgi:hypothetical protein
METRQAKRSFSREFDAFSSILTKERSGLADKLAIMITLHPDQ